jgi:UDP-glucose 4-epimerase
MPAHPAANSETSLPRVLLTGGAGYLGSHTYVALREAGFEPVIVDNFSNSDPAVLQRLEQLTGQPVLCEPGDVGQTAWLSGVLQRHRVRAVIHFAGLKAVGESVQQPLRYYRTNVAGLLSLLEAMQGTTCRQLVFSSSATVYGEPASAPVNEDAPCAPQSPYAHSKWVGEQMLNALGVSEPSWQMGVLRYFNPVGAHPSGLIGEDPCDLPNNLMPLVSQVAVGRRSRLQVFGKDYATPDGTGVRDYVHVCDLAQGHVAAVQALLAGTPSFTLNLGTGRGSSVLELIRAFERASGRRIEFSFAARRPGDVATYFADVSRAREVLGWQATRGLDQMCRDAWHWQAGNPLGYRSGAPASAELGTHARQPVHRPPAGLQALPAMRA